MKAFIRAFKYRIVYKVRLISLILLERQRNTTILKHYNFFDFNAILMLNVKNDLLPSKNVQSNKILNV